jgi:hypothetical protein
MNAQQLQTLLADHQIYHSDLQMDAFITGKSGGTPYGEYKQALRELKSRTQTLKSLYANRELVQLAIRKAEIELEQKRQSAADLEDTIADTVREFTRFYRQAEILKAEVGVLTPERRNELDVDMWVHRIKCMTALDFLTTGRWSRSTVELVSALPPIQKAEITQAIKNPPKLIEWYEQQETRLAGMPQMNGEARDVQKLITGDDNGTDRMDSHD